MNTAPLSDVGWRVRLHPQGRNRDTILGESLLSSPLFYRGFMNFSTALLSMTSLFESTCCAVTFEPYGRITIRLFFIHFLGFSPASVFVILTKFSLPLPVLTLVFSVPGARSSAAARRYSPTKTHMHFESLVKKSL